MEGRACLSLSNGNKDVGEQLSQIWRAEPEFHGACSYHLRKEGSSPEEQLENPQCLGLWSPLYVYDVSKILLDCGGKQ